MSVIGLDVGTSRIKAVRFGHDWDVADSESAPSPVLRSAGGRCEQDMLEVWRHAGQVLAAVVARSHDSIDLVAITAQGDGCWLVDTHGAPSGPAILWNDNRATAIVGGWQSDGPLDAAFEISGCYGAPGLASAQLRWLQDHAPEQLAHSATLLSCGSWIYAQLTGRLVLESTDAANPFFDARSRRYDPALLALFGLDHAQHLLPEVVSGSDRIAGLTRSAAARIGLPAGTPIAIAPYDVPASAIGTGTTRPGTAFGILGTTLCLGVVADDPALSRPANGLTLPGTDTDRWLIAYATLIGTEVLDWTARLLALESAQAVVDLAATSTSDHLPLVLPYLSPAGERSPFLDHAVRGSIHELDITHTPADLAQAAFNGLTLVVLDCLRAAGAPPHSLALCGGGAGSRTWCQDISDATAIPVTLADVSEVGARGAALSGATDLGWFPDLDAAAHAVVHPGRTLEPQPGRTAHYEDLYTHFLATRNNELRS